MSKVKNSQKKEKEQYVVSLEKHPLYRCTKHFHTFR